MLLMRVCYFCVSIHWSVRWFPMLERFGLPAVRGRVGVGVGF